MHEQFFNTAGLATIQETPGVARVEHQWSEGHLMVRHEYEGAPDFGARYGYDQTTGYLTDVLDAAGVTRVHYRNRADGAPVEVTVAPGGPALVTELRQSVLGEDLGHVSNPGSPASVANLIELDQLRRVARFKSGALNASGRAFTYDDAGRLLTVNHPDNTVETYDGSTTSATRPHSTSAATAHRSTTRCATTTTVGSARAPSRARAAT